MTAEFHNRVLTTAGRNLVAHASSANDIVFVAALSSTSYMDDSELVNVQKTSLTSADGIIKTTSATGNVCRIIAEYANQPIAVTVKTVAVTARLSTQSDEDAVVVLAQSDPVAGIYIPAEGDLKTSIQVAFNLYINDADDVSVNPAANVSLGDFERLKERTVTTHADGHADAGDNQTIKGTKAFSNEIIGNGGMTIPSTQFLTVSKIEDSSGYVRLRTQNSSRQAAIELISSEAPSEIVLNAGSVISNSSAKLGTQDKPWNKAYTGQLNIPYKQEYLASASATLAVLGNTIFSGSGDLKIKAEYQYDDYDYDGSGKYHYPKTSKIKFENKTLDSGGNAVSNIYLSFNTDIYGVGHINIANDYGTGGFYVYVNTLFDTTVRFDGATTFTSSITANSNISVSKNITVDGVINGITPERSGSTTTIPVGGIALVYIEKINTFGSNNCHAGEKLPTSTSDYNLYIAKSNGGSFETTVGSLTQVTVTNKNQFLLLNDIEQPYSGIALIMRLEDLP